MSKERIKFDSEMSWPEYKAFHTIDKEAFGAAEAWEHYHRMRWEYFQKLRPFIDSVQAYRAIPLANNPLRFDHN